jgi:hypothetical protein
VEELGRRVDIQRTNTTNHEKNGWGCMIKVWNNQIANYIWFFLFNFDSHWFMCILVCDFKTIFWLVINCPSPLSSIQIAYEFKTFGVSM